MAFMTPAKYVEKERADFSIVSIDWHSAHSFTWEKIEEYLRSPLFKLYRVSSMPYIRTQNPPFSYFLFLYLLRVFINLCEMLFTFLYYFFSSCLFYPDILFNFFFFSHYRAALYEGFTGFCYCLYQELSFLITRYFHYDKRAKLSLGLFPLIMQERKIVSDHRLYLENYLF